MMKWLFSSRFESCCDTEPKTEISGCQLHDSRSFLTQYCKNKKFRMKLQCRGCNPFIPGSTEIIIKLANGSMDSSTGRWQWWFTNWSRTKLQQIRYVDRWLLGYHPSQAVLHFPEPNVAGTHLHLLHAEVPWQEVELLRLGSQHSIPLLLSFFSPRMLPRGGWRDATQHWLGVHGWEAENHGMVGVFQNREEWQLEDNFF